MQRREALSCNKDSDSCHNWVCSIKYALDHYGFSHVWLNGVGNESLFLKLFKQRMIDCFKQSWDEKVRESERFATYRSFKELHQTEIYLSEITLSKFRNVFVKLRFGINDLLINKRYSNTTKNCHFCGRLEDELHVLFFCPGYRTLREKYIARHINETNSRVPVTLKCLLQSPNTTVIRDVAMFMYYALKRREETLINPQSNRDQL